MQLTLPLARARGTLWTLIYFFPLLYFTLLDQPGFIPSVKTFSVALALIIFAPWLIARLWQRTTLPVTSLDYLFPLVILVHLTSAALSPSFRLTFYNLWLVLLTILVFYLMLDQLQAGREKFLWQALFLVVTLVLGLALLEFLVWYLGLLPALGFEVSWPAVAGWTLPPHPRRLGLALATVPVAPPFSAYVALFIPVALGLALSSQRLSIRLSLGGGILLSLGVLLFTFSRTGLVALAVSLAIFAGLAWLTRQQLYDRSNQEQISSNQVVKWANRLKKRWFLLIIMLTILVFALLLFLNRAYLTGELIENRNSSNQIRLALLQAAILMWQDSPLWGQGPGLFGLFYRNYIAPNSFFLLNLSTHSFYFQMLAEEGLAGLGLACVIAVTAGKAAYQRLFETKAGLQQRRLLGVTAALLGYFVTAAIEQLWWPAFIIPVALLAAYLFYRPSAGPISVGTLLSLRRWLPGFYLILLILFGVTIIYTNAIAQRFLDLTQVVPPGRELAVAAELGQLQQLDPGLPMYTVGQAYYLGRHLTELLQLGPCAPPPNALAAASQTMLTEAIRRYEQGLNPIKAHPVYWANLASLYWLNSQANAAQKALEQAINLSTTTDPQIEIYLLNSGCYYELQGHTAAAIQVYAQLLERQPHLVTSSFWQASKFRAENLPQIITTTLQLPAQREDQLLLTLEMALAQGKTEVVEDLTVELTTAFPDAPSGWHWQVRQLLKQNRYPESLALAHQLEDYNLLGEIALAKGDTTLAQTYFRQALFFNSGDPAARFQLAQQAIAEGKSDEAIAYLKPITRPLLRPSTADSKFIYGYPADFPLYDSLLVITAPPLDGQPYYLLMQLYLEQGQTALAEEVKQALATYEPYPLN